MAAVTDTQAAELADAAAEWSMDVLYEVHNEEEMARLHALSPRPSGSIIAICVAETSLDATRNLARGHRQVLLSSAKVALAHIPILLT